MDWFSWLSKTRLDPSLVYEYGLAFSHNELEEEDIPYFNHEFLQSMGISIAKHRLEILKLARRERGNHHFTPVSRLIVALKRTRTSLGRLIRTWVRGDDSTALVLVSRRSSSPRWKRSSKRVSSMGGGRPERLLLTNGSSSPPAVPGSKIDSFSSPMAYGCYDKTDHRDDPCWSPRVEEIRWDAMFQDLKPT